ncbi:MAG TPA: DNA repair protein RadC [Chloroflexota bacterium]|nr:DNA repair protein RadC [Chloroflexota bacterium]
MAPRRKVREPVLAVADPDAAPESPVDAPSLTLKDLDPTERPRERLLELGPRSLTNAELVAILLRTGVAGLMVTDLARKLLAEFDGLAGLAAAAPQDIARKHGLGPAKAAQLKAALEIGHRLLQETTRERTKIAAPEDLKDLVYHDMVWLDHEQLRVILLDMRNRVLATRILYEGSLNQSTVRIAEIFKVAIRENAANVAIVHNHPSGDPSPSPEDIRVTRDLVAAGKLLDIEVVDHVIIGRSPQFVSLRQRGAGW